MRSNLRNRDEIKPKREHMKEMEDENEIEGEEVLRFEPRCNGLGFLISSININIL